MVNCRAVALISSASSTDMYTTWPNTGQTVVANLRIENTTCAPDGSNNRVCMLINGRYPGPTIVANWGDTIRVTVRNLLQANGTSLHWHGFRMLNTTIQDGTNGITECALAPGDIKTYQFQATEYGTTVRSTLLIVRHTFCTNHLVVVPLSFLPSVWRWCRRYCNRQRTRYGQLR